MSCRHDTPGNSPPHTPTPTSKSSTQAMISSMCWSTWPPKSANFWRVRRRLLRLLRLGCECDRRHRMQFPQGGGLHSLLAARLISYVRIVEEQYSAHGHKDGMLHHRSTDRRVLPGQHSSLDKIPYRRS